MEEANAAICALKSSGQLEEALVWYERLMAVQDGDGLDRAWVLCEHAECLEACGRHEAAVLLLQPLEGKDALATVLLVKLYYSAPFSAGQNRAKIPPLLFFLASEPQRAHGGPATIDPARRQRFKSYLAYLEFIAALVAAQPAPSPGVPSAAHPLFVVGDSHVLSMAWQTTDALPLKDSHCRQFVPFLITGLKAYHCQVTGRGFPSRTNLLLALRAIAALGGREIIFSAGEIDCREGIDAAVTKGKYASVEKAVDATVALYLAGLTEYSAIYGLSIYLLPVVPGAVRANTKGFTFRQHRRCTTQLFNAALRARLIPSTGGKSVHFVDCEAALYDHKLGALHPHLNADGVHMNQNCVPIVVRTLQGLLELS